MAKLSRKGQGARRAPDREDRALRSRARADVRRREPPRSEDAGPPTFIEPCISTTVAKVPPGDEWLHEFKWDGYRLMLRIDTAVSPS